MPNENSIGRDLCAALGLQEHEVVSLDLHAKVNELVTTTVVYLNTDELNNVIQVLQRYTL